MKRFRPICARWISLICCGGLASVVSILLNEPQRAICTPVIEYLALFRPEFLACAVLILIAAVCWPFGHGRWLAFFGVRHFVTYPPLWVAGAISLLIIALYTGITSSWIPISEGARTLWWMTTKVPLWLWMLVGVASIVPLASSWWCRRGRTAEHGVGKDANLTRWLQDDHEITDPNADRFGHDEIAKRIVERLKSKGDSPTMAVVGPLGSGKSTIRRLVEYHLQEEQSIHVLNLSLWPFDCVEAAVAGVLRSVIRAIGEHVNILAVTGLSERYVAAIERAGGRWGAFARLLRSDSRPEAILEGLDSIATATGVKFVLWIEDMERFTGADRLPPEQAAIREAERLGPLLSLLVLLDRCHSVSVIVGDTSLRSRLDVGKIARFVESPPRLTPQLAWEQIAMLRSKCLGKNHIDPASENYRSSLLPCEKSKSIAEMFGGIQFREPSIHEALALLLDTPRSFKVALACPRFMYQLL